MKKYQREIIGIYLLFIALFIFISLLTYKIISLNNVMGPVGHFIAEKLIFYFGFGSYVRFSSVL